MAYRQPRHTSEHIHSSTRRARCPSSHLLRRHPCRLGLRLRLGSKRSLFACFSRCSLRLLRRLGARILPVGAYHAATVASCFGSVNAVLHGSQARCLQVRNGCVLGRHSCVRLGRRARQPRGECTDKGARHVLDASTTTEGALPQGVCALGAAFKKLVTVGRAGGQCDANPRGGHNSSTAHAPAHRGALAQARAPHPHAGGTRVARLLVVPLEAALTQPFGLLLCVSSPGARNHQAERSREREVPCQSPAGRQSSVPGTWSVPRVELFAVEACYMSDSGAGRGGALE